MTIYVYVMQNKFVIHENVSNRVAFLCTNAGRVVCMGTCVYIYSLLSIGVLNPLSVHHPNSACTIFFILSHRMTDSYSNDNYELNPLSEMDLLYSPVKQLMCESKLVT